MMQYDSELVIIVISRSVDNGGSHIAGTGSRLRVYWQTVYLIY